MRRSLSSRVATKSAALLALAFANPVSAHSWIEWAKKIAPNGTMVGDEGYARGYMPRDQADWSDSVPTYLLPNTGSSAYTGDEILNKYSFQANPAFPMLEAAAGDHIAIIHLENGHTTLPQNQPNKPRNRGTIYFYGTTQPKDKEKLFDVHLLWNQDGTGGDKRGKLLGTRNYDDGQCYQPNDSELADARVSKLAADGALATQELACQSDLQLPSDLKAGDVYTIYWYWDWPDLNGDKIDMAATKDGLYPWAGSFMRDGGDPHGFTMDAILKNESYSSVMDIKITGATADSFAAKGVSEESWVPDQNVYSKAIEGQMDNNFQVDVDGGAAGGGGKTAAPTTPVTTPTATPGGGNDGVKTVTVTETVPPTTLVTTVFKTVPAGSTPTPSPDPPGTTIMITKTVHVPSGTQGGDKAKETTPSTPDPSDLNGTQDVTPFMRRARRTAWGFGR